MMLDRKTPLWAMLVAALALAGPSGAVAAQDSEPSMQTLTGTIVAVVDADGASEYYLQVADGSRLKLSVGPPWYWGSDDPLAGYVDQVVEVQGYDKTGVPDERAADIAKERAVAEASFDVRVIGDEVLWTTFRPPWAGGPGVVGEVHPGYAGWSRGQEASEAAQENAEGGAGGVLVMDERNPGFQGWNRGQAAREAKAANSEEVRSNAGSTAKARAGGPKVVGESHPGHAGWSRGQAAKAAGAAKAPAPGGSDEAVAKGRP
jgi:hypothetical protein